jgi:hypothetical protein
MTISRTYKIEFTVLVDEEDADLLDTLDAAYERGFSGAAFLRSTSFGGYMGLHRAILARQGKTYGKGYQCDHINRNPSDNQRCNLRIVTAAENQRNRKNSTAIQSEYTGVKWVNKRGWCASIDTRENGKHKWVATRSRKNWSEIDAAVWRDLQIRQLGLDTKRNFTTEQLEQHISNKGGYYDNGEPIRKTSTERVAGNPG